MGTEQYREYKHCLVWNGDPSVEEELSNKDAKRLIRLYRSLMLRNIYDWDCKEVTNYWFIIKDSYNENDYPKKTRKYIQKANERFIYKLIPRSLLSEQGYDIYEKAYSNYKIKDGFHLSKEVFLNNINNYSDDVDIWGAIDKESGRLEAYSICKKGYSYCEFQTSKANPEFLPKFYIMYGLYDARNRYYLEEKSYQYVVSSARSLSEHSNVQNFMIEKMLFRKAYCKIRIFYSPMFKILISTLYPFRKIIPYAPLRNVLKFEMLNKNIDF